MRGIAVMVSVAVVSASLAHCGTVHEVPPSTSTSVKGIKAGGFPHEIFDGVLKTFNEGGFVDYGSLARDRRTLDDYLVALAEMSPRSHPELFPGREHELTYWINAYNALIFQNVLSHYPFESLEGKLFKTRFFYQDEFILGGERISLYDLENTIIRPTYGDPRIHFALNCASYSCPRLPEEAFVPEKLEDQLERQSRLFMAEERNVSVDEAAGRIVVSSIFDWYKDDFIDHRSVKSVSPDSGERLIAYLNRYLPPDRQIPSRPDGWKIEFREYDWTLNDRR
jgi:hypothetical protein